MEMVSDAELDEFVAEIEAEKEEAGKQPNQWPFQFTQQHPCVMCLCLHHDGRTD